MIFVGDIALPFVNSIEVKDLPEELSNKQWFGNLEGGVVDNSTGDFKQERGVFNDTKAIEELTNKFNFVGFALANNHIIDLTSIETNFNFLDSLNMPYCGVGNNISDATRPLILDVDNNKVIILNFGWEVIQCEIASEEKEGVNPLTKEHVLYTVEKYVNKYPEAKVIPYMHWSYELEAEPQPFERELAKQMIDLGVAGVIGSHPHRIGGFEVYRDKPIVYSLGNWLFKQNYYFDGKLSFPDFCNRELAFEWDFVKNSFKFHFFEYNKKESSLIYIGTEDQNSVTMRMYTPFSDLSDKEYIGWYKKNHYHKNKGLPVYYWDDSHIRVRMKNWWVSTRAKLMKLILNKGK